MVMKNETRTPEAADPVIVAIGSTLVTSAGSVAFSGLEKGSGMEHLKGGALTANPNYPVSGPLVQSISEESTVPPVADWLDNDPHIMCRWCHIQVRFGRGPIEFVDYCPICKNEIEEVEHA